MDGVESALQSAASRLQWRWYFEYGPGLGEGHENAGNQSRFFRSRDHKPAPFTKTAPPELKTWLRGLRETISGCLENVRRRSTGRRKWWTNVTPLVLAARSLLARSIYVAVPTDKDGGFCLAPKVFYPVSFCLLTSILLFIGMIFVARQSDVCAEPCLRNLRSMILFFPGNFVDYPAEPRWKLYHPTSSCTARRMRHLGRSDSELFILLQGIRTWFSASGS